MMDKSKKHISSKESDQFLYLGRWVDKHQFRAFVYNEQGEEKLADNYPEYQALITSGIWFASKPDITKIRKSKHVSRDTDS